MLLPTSIEASIVPKGSVATRTLLTKEVALTFDDGPYGTSTNAVLDILKAENVHATFFLVGQNVEKFPAITKRIMEDGNMIGNHTYDHPLNLPEMTIAQLHMELSKTNDAIASTTGIHPTLFRPPYGNITKKLWHNLRIFGYTPVLWNVDPRDWDHASSTSDKIITHVLNHLKTHMILLLHDGRDTHIDYPRDNMLGALPRIIHSLKKRGYTFVTVDKLIKLR